MRNKQASMKHFYVQNKYFHRIEALKRFPGNTVMLCDMVAMLSQIFSSNNTVTSLSYSQTND